MALSLLLSIFLLWSLLLSTPTTALDITKILDQHPNYALFNQLLTKTHVAEEINKRESVTVLAIPNAAMPSVATQDEETLIRNIMKIHVVLDYYDSAKIKKVEDGTTLTTLYQTTASTDKDAGFLKVTKENNDIKLILAASGSSVSARVTKVVTSIPSEISIVEVSNAIVPPGFEGSTISSTDSSSDSDSDSDSSPAPSPRKHHKHHKAPAPSPSDADDEKDSDSPAPSPHKHGHDHKNTHKNAPAPCDDSDGASDDADPDDGDANDADADDDEEDDDMGTDEVPSSSPRNAIASGFVLLASLFAIML